MTLALTKLRSKSGSLFFLTVKLHVTLKCCQRLMGEKMQNCFELTSLNHIVQCELRRKLLASWFCAVWEVFCVYSKWALENTIAFDLKINLHVAQADFQMESCCVLLNSINGEYPLKKAIDFISWDLNETWNAIVHETVLNHVAAKTLQLTPSELEKNANTVQDRGKDMLHPK